LDKKEVPHKMLVKTTTTNWKFKPHQAKGFIRRRNFHNVRRKLHKKRIVDCIKKHLFYSYLNLVTSMRLSLHVFTTFEVQKINCTCTLSMKHEHG